MGTGKTLAGRNEIIDYAEQVRKVFPGRPIWLTEWSIEGGENALSVVAMADTWLGLVQRPDLFEAASYFQMNAKERLFEYEPKNGSYTKASYGAVFEILREAFDGSEVLETRVSSLQLADGLDAVSAEAVVKDGRISIIAVNKSDKPVRLKLTLDGHDEGLKFSHRALCFDSAGDFKRFGLSENPLLVIAAETEGISLPPLSISRIDPLDVPHSP